ncbi:CDP-alcohol phosphatidyltransferase family protein [Neisseriaceae bacterium PsAf]|nr:CDP-alcohol phosphatidyltransferase family protein [Neisseriaceae bacterium PsAf]
MSVYDLKPKFQQILVPYADFLHRKNITANQVTATAGIISILIGLTVLLSDNLYFFLLLPIWFFLRMALNAIDGMIATKYNQQTSLGIILNELCDVVSDTFMYLPFLLISPFSFQWIAIIIWLAMLTEFIAILGKINTGERQNQGPMGKSDRALLFSVIAIIIVVFQGLPDFFIYIIYLIIFLLLITLYNRFKRSI